MQTFYNIEEIENRFKYITGLQHIDLSKSIILESDYKNQQQKTTKELSKKYGFVATPLFLVDKMIQLKFKDLTLDSKTCDLCAGHGQFSIRLLRQFYNKFKKMNIKNWLTNNHTFTELQPISCAKLVYIFGPSINLYVGDSMNLKYSVETDTGILFFDDKTKKWLNNNIINKLLSYKTIQQNLKALAFIFNNYNNIDKLTILLNALEK